MEFSTSQFLIRPFLESDLDAFMEYRNNLEWMKYQSFKGLTKQEYRQRLLGNEVVEAGIQLAIIQKTSQALIGDLFLFKKANTLTIGYSINPKYSQKGYMTSIIQEYIKVLYNHYPECEIVAFTEKDNIASKKVLLHNGFKFEEWVEVYQSELYVHQK